MLLGASTYIFIVGATDDQYYSLVPAFSQELAIDDAILPANNSAKWDPHSLHYNKSDLMVKI